MNRPDRPSADAPRASTPRHASAGSAETERGAGDGQAARTYTVEKGDTLSHIAKQFYGRASHWQTLFEANRDQIADPDLIQPGQVLRIPPVPAAEP